MSFHDMSEAEKAEYLRSRVFSFLPSVVIGLVVGGGGYFAYDVWQEIQSKHNVAASMAFTEFVEGDWVEQDYSDPTDEELTDYGQYIEQGEALIERFPDHFYSALARFILTRLRLEKKEFEPALAYLDQIIQGDHENYTTALAYYRKAQVYYAMGDNAQALEALSQVNSPALEVVTHDLRGDIKLRESKFEQAYQDWQSALTASESDALKDYLQVKLDFIESIPPNEIEQIVSRSLDLQRTIAENKELEKKAQEEAERAEAESREAESDAEQSSAGESTEEPTDAQ